MAHGKTYKRRSQLRQQRQKKVHNQRFFLFKLRWLLLLLITIPLLSYALTMDAEVRERFEGKRWALPAKVFARPLEIYAGMEIKLAEVQTELSDSGYRKTSSLDKPGDYYTRGRDVFVYTRPFSFWDGKEPARKIRIRFKNKGTVITHIAELEKRKFMPVLRLDPMQIAKIYPTHKEDRSLVKIKKVPPLLIQALIAVEDREFYTHNGINLYAIGRAVWMNIKGGSWSQGGSTLTQQLVKNLILTPERTLKRKFNEASMALLLELHYEKDEILEAYLNEVYFGQNGAHEIHGVATASWFYFNRPLEQLDIPEIALLVGLIRGASYYNPRKNPEKAKKRRALILKQMYQQGVISEVQMEESLGEPLNVVAKQPRSKTPYPAFLDMVRLQLKEDYREEDLRSEGLQVFTTLDPMRQRQAQTAMVKRIHKLEKQNRKLRGKLNGALVVTRPENGEVLAVIGDRRAGFSGFNRALNAKRSVGSLIKPAIYLTALENSRTYSLLSSLDDSKFEWTDKQTGKVWKPRNYSGKIHGKVPLFKALGYSYNLATVHLGFELGLDTVKNTLIRLGLDKDITVYPATLLGGIDLSPVEVTQMYQTLASGGFRTPLRTIRDVLAHDGKPLNRYGVQVEPRFNPASVFLLNHALQQAVRGGTGRSTAKALLPEHMRLAGKTGTTNNYRDSWFAGYGSDLLAVAWVGRDDNKSIQLTGGGGAMKVWADFMRIAKASSLSKTSPKYVQWRRVHAPKGSLTQRAGTVKIPFIVNQDSGMLAYSPG